MAGGGMMGSAPTSMGQIGGGAGAASPMEGSPAYGTFSNGMQGYTSPAATSAAPAQSTGLQFGTPGTGTGGEPMADASQAAVSPMAQQMQAQAPMQNPYAMPMQQQMYRPQMQSQQMGQQSQYGGLQSLLSSLMNRYQQPQQRVSQMPQYQNRALGYRPNLSQAQASLGRTATTQAEAQAAAAAKAAAEATSAAEADDFMAWQRQQYNAYKNASNSGGGG